MSTDKLELWCGKCYRLTLHTDMATHPDRQAKRYLRGIDLPPTARHIQATCSVCGTRDRHGYVTTGDPTVGTYAGTYKDWEGA